MKIEKFAQNAVPVVFGVVILLMILYFLIAEGFTFLVLALVLIPVYFVPCFIAYKKNHKFKKQIFLLNIFFILFRTPFVLFCTCVCCLCNSNFH